MKSMKRKKAMWVSKVARGRGAKARVFRGGKERTSGGLKKSDLVKNKDGKVVSRKASQRAKNSKNGKKIAAFGKAVAQARRALGIKGFVPVGGKTARGQALLKKSAIALQEVNIPWHIRMFAVCMLKTLVSLCSRSMVTAFRTMEQN